MFWLKKEDRILIFLSYNMLQASTVMSNDDYSSGKFPKNLQTIENLIDPKQSGGYWYQCINHFKRGTVTLL